MDGNAFYRRRLDEHRDANGDLAPPWARFPEYERSTIGWRMGSGEDWFAMWHIFLDDLDPARAARAAYLRRHPPAPVTWADWVWSVLHPGPWDNDDDDVEAARRAELLGEGFIASDIAYRTWRAQQAEVRWPWAGRHESPEDAARYGTRDAWFWSRQVAELRAEKGWKPPAVPASWEACDAPLRTGRVAKPDLRTGLLTLALFLCAGRVPAPWELGLTPADFADTFDDSMGYADAFRLWCLSALDDREQTERLFPSVPAAWAPWAKDYFPSA